MTMSLIKQDCGTSNVPRILDQRPPQCNYCGEKASPEQRYVKCAGCDMIWYCDPLHQQYDWKRHKIRCKSTHVKDHGQQMSKHSPDILDTAKLIEATGTVEENQEVEEELEDYPPADPGMPAPDDTSLRIIIPSNVDPEPDLILTDHVSPLPVQRYIIDDTVKSTTGMSLKNNHPGSVTTAIHSSLTSSHTATGFQSEAKKTTSSSSITEMEMLPRPMMKRSKTQQSLAALNMVPPESVEKCQRRQVPASESGADAGSMLPPDIGSTRTLINARRFMLGDQTLLQQTQLIAEAPDRVDHTKNRPYSKSLSDHIQNCAAVSVARGVSMTQYQAFCLRIQDISLHIIHHLKEFGWCVIDTFLGEAHCTAVTREVQLLYSRGLFHNRLEQYDSQNQIFWYDNREVETKDAMTVGFLISMFDSLIIQLEGKIPHTINGRAPAMLSCYPGNGRRRSRAIENSARDGRCITTTYFLNKDWKNQDGGLLRLYPNTSKAPVDIEPLCDRLVMYWTDRRVPSETLPAFNHRFAIHIWYFDAKEKADANLRRQMETKAGSHDPISGSFSSGYTGQTVVPSQPRQAAGNSALSTLTSTQPADLVKAQQIQQAQQVQLVQQLNQAEQLKQAEQLSQAHQLKAEQLQQTSSHHVQGTSPKRARFAPPTGLMSQVPSMFLPHLEALTQQAPHLGHPSEISLPQPNLLKDALMNAGVLPQTSETGSIPSLLRRASLHTNIPSLPSPGSSFAGYSTLGTAGTLSPGWENAQAHRLIEAQRFQAERTVELMRRNSGMAADLISFQDRLNFAPRLPSSMAEQWARARDSCILPTVNSSDLGDPNNM